MAEIRDTIAKYAEPMPDVILTGDFNLPHATWPEGTPGPGTSGDEQEMLRCLTEVADEFFLQQHITQATHRRGNTLDLFFYKQSTASP